MKGFILRRQPQLTLFLSARFVAMVALQMQSVAVGWQVYQMTGDPLDLGLIGLAQFAPFLPLVLLAGQAADRFDRKWIIALCYGAELVCAVALWLLTQFGVAAVWPVFAVMTLYGAARAFMMPATQSIVMNLVGPADFRQAVALGSSTFQIAVIVGPALGGVLYLAGPRIVYGTVSALLALALMLLALTRVRFAEGRGNPIGWDGLFDGFRYVRSNRPIFGAISLDLFAVLFGGATALLPAYAHDVLQVGPEGLGLLRSAPAIGAALTALVLAFRPISRHVGRWMFDGVFLFGAATVVLALSRDFRLSLCALLLMGIGDMVSVYIRHSLIQLDTPDAIRGRVSAVNSIFIGASNELGEFESGLTAAWFGLVPSILLGGLATLAVGALWLKLFPTLRVMGEFPHPGNGADLE